MIDVYDEGGNEVHSFKCEDVGNMEEYNNTERRLIADAIAKDRKRQMYIDHQAVIKRVKLHTLEHRKVDNDKPEFQDRSKSLKVNKKLERRIDEEETLAIIEKSKARIKFEQAKIKRLRSEMKLRMPDRYGQSCDNYRLGREFWQLTHMGYGEFRLNQKEIYKDNVVYDDGDNSATKVRKQYRFYQGFRHASEDDMWFADDIRERMAFMMPRYHLTRLRTAMRNKGEERYVDAKSFIDLGYDNLLAIHNIGLETLAFLAKVLEPFLNDEQRKEWGLDDKEN